ncbi:2-amino-3-carboxymuconate-6-semialdehyde decarboxylase [Aspergillus heteromorphus CBS 117.55]|uniref:6-methylsalicylate decarboxylase n=1 Tax=Aspergillus heteromorphus CBS 117.55 TaxID=1448321 RepID=A0A317WGQ6_9EURO|nr:2-amino-3-carboxymuconate-6-semialdehyde decarboxylase [Aspergillus heteromorphus CBS 117.55]PWY83380.1 2-amino-3-carboxymuconate-6-semialdehyde decarboxylase [Aspergillus heteromorphus CBS 117.55]
MAHQLPPKIDTHHHFVPEFYRQAVEDAGGDPTGLPVPAWTVEDSLNDMEANGVRRAILSLTTPGAVIAGDNESIRALAREANQYAANIRDRYPEQFGFLAALPSLLDIPGTLAEIEYALDVLQADGVTVFTRYGDGNNYLGHSQFTPVWRELDARKAVVLIHPTMPADKNWIDPIMPPPMLDFPQETTRTAVDMIVNNVTQQFPNCPKILSHAGGTLPYLISRLAVTSEETMSQKGPYGKTYFEFMDALRSFYYDLALSSAPAVLNLLMDLVPHEHILYGSDYPNAPPIKVAGYRENLDAFAMDEELRKMVYFENAQRLFSK